MENKLSEIPAVMSLEGRAQLISDEIARVEHAGNPAARREHVKAVALAHLRAALMVRGEAG